MRTTFLSAVGWLLLIATCTVAIGADDTPVGAHTMPRLHRAYVADTTSLKGKLSVSTANPRVVAGDRVTFDVSFQFEAGPEQLLNPFLDSALPSPAQALPFSRRIAATSPIWSRLPTPRRLPSIIAL